MNWGIISYGRIAPKFLASLHSVAGEKLVAIATASQRDRVRQDYPDCKVYQNYEELYKDSQVDIVYISSTHDQHYDHAMKCLQSGKHVLCEKPMTTSAKLTSLLIQEARKQNLFLMEAIWTRFIPGYQKILSFLKEGKIGEVQLVRASFSFSNDKDPKGRLYNKALAGGSTYDIGLYNISLALDIFGQNPKVVRSTGILSDTGIDEASVTTLLFPGGGIADLHCGFRLHTDKKGIIYGSKGWIEMEHHWKVEKFRLYKFDGELQEEYNLPLESTGYAHEIRGVTECIKSGKIESELISHEMSIQIATIMDEILNQLGYNE